MVILLSSIIASIIALMSILLLRKRFHPLKIFGCYLFVTTIHQITLIVISLNLKLIKFPNKEIIFWTIKLSGTFLQPLAIVWLLSFIESNIHVYKKVILFVTVICLLVLMDYFFLQVGYVTFPKWGLHYSALKYILLILLTILYKVFLQKLIKKEQVNV